jgi:hypothetical protein
MMKRRDVLKLAAGLSLIPLVNQASKLRAAPQRVRRFDDEEPYGFQPPHQRCTKWEKPKSKDK